MDAAWLGDCSVFEGSQRASRKAAGCSWPATKPSQRFAAWVDCAVQIRPWGVGLPFGLPAAQPVLPACLHQTCQLHYISNAGGADEPGDHQAWGERKWRRRGRSSGKAGASIRRLLGTCSYLPSHSALAGRQAASLHLQIAHAAGAECRIQGVPGWSEGHGEARRRQAGEGGGMTVDEAVAWKAQDVARPLMRPCL